MFEDKLVTGLRLAPGGAADPALRIQLRLPWYRALPLACVEKLEVSLDGEPLAESGLTVVMNGARYGIDEFPSLREVWWFVLDVLELEFAPGRVVAPGRHRVAASLGLLVPYGDGDWRPQLAIRQLAVDEKDLVLTGKDD
ncbi:C-glycoside deglycosidase beta subunit domain-containing protein [Microbacterium sp. RD1]|uniref:C-glycoside deglycosidase beta subunit domain-containing protein n=1 Tax=Microbacterium sp. RD1 TaxID=3457313 RepID=UPI003FA57B8A